MTITEAKRELEKFVRLKTTMRPVFVDVILEALPKWTPCSEALPINEDYVLCTTEKKNGDRSVVRGYYTGSTWACGMNSNVVAWMPLPEAYKGENV